MCVTTRRRSRLAPTWARASLIIAPGSPEFMPASARSASAPSANKNTLTLPSSKGIGSRSSKTASATSVKPPSVNIPAFSLTAVVNIGFVTRPVAQEKRMSEEQMTPDQIIEALPKYLIPEKAGSTKATIQFDLSGDGGGKWWMKIHDGVAESGKGDAPEPANLRHHAPPPRRGVGGWGGGGGGGGGGSAAPPQGKQP